MNIQNKEKFGFLSKLKKKQINYIIVWIMVRILKSLNLMMNKQKF